MKSKSRRNITTISQLGQASMELAVFGAVLLFVLGIIIRQAVNNSFQQNQQLKAMRLAMTKSFQYSEGLKGDRGDPREGEQYKESENPLIGAHGLGEVGTASRNVASVLFIEDRLSPSSDKYGSQDRMPQIYGGSATHSRNLFLPTDVEEKHNLPVFDVYINGQHFAFLSANFKTVIVDEVNNYKESKDIPAGTPLKKILFTRVPNHPALIENEDTTDSIMKWRADCPDLIACDRRFDLDRDGDWGAPKADVPADLRATFAWQWKRVPLKDIHPDTPKAEEEVDNVSVDVDGDLKEETVIYKKGTTLTVIDYQKGDLDFTVNDDDYENMYVDDCDDENPCLKISKRRVPGLQRDMYLYTQAKDGTYLLIEEGKLFQDGGRQFVRSVQKKDRVDLIQREIFLSNNTGRFCAKAEGGTRRPAKTVEGEKNPVKICCSGGSCYETGGAAAGATNCFFQNSQTETISRTCYDMDTKTIYVRSPIKDEFGRKWIGKVKE